MPPHATPSRPGRRSVALVPIVLSCVFASGLVFDPRFSRVSSDSAVFWFIALTPSVVFLVIGIVRFRRGRIWPLWAFTVGWIVTGLFHRQVADETYGNPGYMVPFGHVLAPVVSLVAYLAATLLIWLAVKIGRLVRKS